MTRVRLTGRGALVLCLLPFLLMVGMAFGGATGPGGLFGQPLPGPTAKATQAPAPTAKAPTAKAPTAKAPHKAPVRPVAARKAPRATPVAPRPTQARTAPHKTPTAKATQAPAPTAKATQAPRPVPAKARVTCQQQGDAMVVTVYVDSPQAPAYKVSVRVVESTGVNGEGGRVWQGDVVASTPHYGGRYLSGTKALSPWQYVQQSCAVTGFRVAS